MNIGKEQKEGKKVEGLRSSEKVGHVALRRNKGKQHEWKEQD